jgi:hypothetical protein
VLPNRRHRGGSASAGHGRRDQKLHRPREAGSAASLAVRRSLQGISHVPLPRELRRTRNPLAVAAARSSSSGEANLPQSLPKP